MTQITGIGFSNFRVFSKPTTFNLAPISIFTGTNSSGKSSIFKGLVLLKDNIDDLFKLNFSGEHHKLGTFGNIKNKLGIDNSIVFDLNITIPKSDNLFVDSFNFKFYFDQDPVFNENGTLSQIVIYSDNINVKEYSSEDILFLITRNEEQDVLYFNLKYFFDKLKNEILPDFEQVTKQMVANGDGSFSIANEMVEKATKYIFYTKELNKVADYDFNLISVQKLKSLLPSFTLEEVQEIARKISNNIFNALTRFPLKRGLGLDEYGTEFIKNFSDIFDTYTKFLSNDHGGIIRGITETEVSHFLDDELSSQLKNDNVSSVYVSEIVDPGFFTVCKELIIPVLKATFENLKKEVANLEYIEGIRANSHRLYTNQSQGTTFNHLLLDVGQKWSTKFKIQSLGMTPYEFVQKWIVGFDIGDGIEINRVNGVATDVRIQREGQEVNLIDMGYGITQFLPILLTIASKYELKGNYSPNLGVNLFQISENNGPILLIEEPESNLHPRLQSLLADFFVDVAKHFKITLLIETHSEYLIRRLQVLTASDKVKPEHSVIYYLDGNVSSDSDKFVKKININPDGSLTKDFGHGFIDEATNWKMELMRLKNAQLQNLN